MSVELVRERCVPCRRGQPTLSEMEIAQLQPHVPGWSIAEKDGIKRLEKAFKFKDFAGALAFTVRIGELAESEDHHPSILTEWGRVTVSWWTHVIRGLHRNDFIMAAKTDLLLS